MTSADKRRVRKALDGVAFPATREDLIDYGEQRDAGPKTSEALRALPDREFHNIDEVERHVPQSPARALGEE